MGKLKVLDLFSGIGGFSLGLERTGGFETVAFCEIDPFCQKVLKKHWPDVPIYNDVRTLEHDGKVDVICGGYPCQPDSVAGKQKAENDPRNLRPFVRRAVEKFNPSICIFENVKGHIKLGLDGVLSDLESLSYSTETYCFEAKSFGANHGRERVWLVAHAAGHGCNEGAALSGNVETNDRGAEGKNKNWNDEGRSGLRPLLERGGYSPWGWGTEPPAFRVDDGLPDRMDRNKAIGNSLLPQIPEIIGHAILQSMKETP